MHEKKIILIVLISALLLLVACEVPQELCGNGVVNEGETAQNCCLDIPCSDGSCVDNQCISENGEVVCGDCQYLEDGTCKDYACCTDDQCGQGMNCINNECVAEERCECGMLTDGVCIPYACCSNEDCNDNNPLTNDLCLSAGKRSASCSNEPVGAQCKRNSDCDDDNPRTLDTCEGTPKICKNMLPGVKDCGEDWDCLIDRVEDCEKTLLTNTKMYESSGSVITNVDSFEITEFKDRLCTMTISVKTLTLHYTSDYEQSLRANGMTQEAIDEQERADEQSLKAEREGLSVACGFSAKEHENLLQRIRDGTVKGSLECNNGECERMNDFTFADNCVGNYSYDPNLRIEEAPVNAIVERQCTQCSCHVDSCGAIRTTVISDGAKVHSLAGRNYAIDLSGVNSIGGESRAAFTVDGQSVGIDYGSKTFGRPLLELKTGDCAQLTNGKLYVESIDFSQNRVNYCLF